MVTIIMPAFNCERYLEESVKSVIEQTYRDWKLLIIDDCSTDGTRKMSEALAAKDKRIKLIHNEENLGVGRTRNKGVKEASSDWIAFLDSDDLWDPEKLEKQISFSRQNPEAGLIYTASSFINEDGEQIDHTLEIPPRINRKRLLKQNLISCSSVIVKRELLLRYPMPEDKVIHEDFATWLNILSHEQYAYGINEPLLTYRLSASSKSGNKFKAARMNWNTYKKCGLTSIAALYNMFWYTINGIRKYRKLR